MRARGVTLGILRRLRAAGHLPPPRRRVGRIPRSRPPLAIGEGYSRAIAKSVLLGARGVLASVLPEILELLAGERREQGHADAGGERAPSWRSARAQELLRSASRSMAKKLRPAALHEVAKRFGEKTDEHARRQLDQQLRSAISIPLSTIERPVQDRIGGWVADNVALIKTVPERYFDRLQEDVQVAFAAGTRPEALTQQLEDRYAMAERDARRIARDQVLKLSSDVNHDRLKSIGVERGIWRTMRDERVSADCLALEGREYDIADGVDGVFPGKEHPMCRCFCEPVLTGLFDTGPVRSAA